MLSTRKLLNLAIPAALAAAILFQAVPAAAQCTPELPAEDVVVRIRTSPPSSEITRREHARITPALASALCITSSDVSSNGDRSPQVRVELTEDPMNASLASTALFTVTSISGSPLPSADRVIEVWDRSSSSSDTHNGRFKLFPTASSASTINNASPPAEAKLYRIAPSATTEAEFYITGYRNPVTTVHYTDPNGDPDFSFEEYFEMGDDHNLAVLVPHGGDIEPGISEHLWRVPLGLDTYTRTVADVWEGVGDWGNVGQTHRRWHITSPDFSAESFPGLANLLDQAASQPYDYAVAIHGFSEDDKGVIIGGQADEDEKCYLALQIYNRFGIRRDEVGVTVFYEDNGVKSHNIEDQDGNDYDHKTHLRGFDSDNVVNRMSPNPSHSAGSGAFQIEISRGLRDDTSLMPSLMSGLGNGLGRLWSYPAGAVGACDDLNAL